MSPRAKTRTEAAEPTTGPAASSRQGFLEVSHRPSGHRLRPLSAVRLARALRALPGWLLAALRLLQSLDRQAQAGRGEVSP